MPYKRVEPVSHGMMMMQKYHGHHTICQTLRDIYVMTKDPEIKMKCRIGMAMTKKMHEKLKFYAGLYSQQHPDDTNHEEESTPTPEDEKR